MRLVKNILRTIALALISLSEIQADNHSGLSESSNLGYLNAPNVNNHAWVDLNPEALPQVANPPAQPAPGQNTSRLVNTFLDHAPALFETESFLRSIRDALAQAARQ